MAIGEPSYSFGGAVPQAKKPPVTVEGKILHETAAAILLEVEGTGIWFPLSQVHSVHHSQTGGDDSRLVVEYWIANKKGLT